MALIDSRAGGDERQRRDAARSQLEISCVSKISAPPFPVLPSEGKVSLNGCDATGSTATASSPESVTSLDCGIVSYLYSNPVKDESSRCACEESGVAWQQPNNKSFSKLSRRHHLGFKKNKNT